MVYDLMDTGCMEDGEPSNVAVDIPADRFSPASLLSNSLYCEMSLPELAAQCLRELDNYRRGEPCTDAYGLELLRRATFQDNQEAWAWVQHCFGAMVQAWLRQHPQRERWRVALRAKRIMSQTFECFWMATAFNQQVECNTLAAALQYLLASLNGAILDMLRAYARP